MKALLQETCKKVSKTTDKKLNDDGFGWGISLVEAPVNTKRPTNAYAASSSGRYP
jgi:hypothetical protein